MPYNVYQWRWEEAFDRFGFDDGDGLVMTFDVADFITSLGYEVDIDDAGIHNSVIGSILMDGKELFGTSTCRNSDPRDHLPKELLGHLDAKFPREEIYATRNW